MVRLRFIASVALTGILSLMTLGTSSDQLLADAASQGRWAAPYEIGAVPIHAILTHNDEILTFEYPEGPANTDLTSRVVTVNWRTHNVTNAAASYDRDFFCAGHVVLGDGRVWVVGGHDHTTGKKQDGVGVATTDLWDPIQRTWTPTAPLGQKRWYPTTVGLSNGTTALTFGGQERRGSNATTVDRYDATTNTMQRLPNSASLSVGSYPWMHYALGSVYKVGSKTIRFDPSTNAWSAVASTKFGVRARGASVLLPIRGDGAGPTRILTTGGKGAGSAVPTATAEVIDLSSPSPTWAYTGSMNHARLLHDLRILADGTVAAVGGGEAYKYTRPKKTLEIYDPSSGTWSNMLPQQASRMYHSTSLLLPDGRLWSAGQDSGDFKTKVEVYSPPYLFRGPRPTIQSSPQQISYNSSFSISTPDATNISKIALVRPGSVTHQIDTDQRYVTLGFSASDGQLAAQAPVSGTVAPPGWYMLFILNSQGVPAVANWIHLQ
ncbi:MAG: DUF1929 domain-containing protein [Actinobacteria bacterium]|nr:DUF1929 domain-containing protein [Actinomycetota bacterium]